MAKSYYHCSDCEKLITVEGRNRRDAQSRAEWMKEHHPRCRDCRNAQEVQEAKAKAAEMELPAIDDGTEKQVAFAEAIRGRLLPPIIDAGNGDAARDLGLFNVELTQFRAEVGNDVYGAIVADIKSRTSARWWIDHRDWQPILICRLLQHDAEKRLTVSAEEVALEEEMLAEAMIRPPEPVTETVVVLEFDDSTGKIYAEFPEKHDGFLEIVKSLGMRWEYRSGRDVVQDHMRQWESGKCWQCPGPHEHYEPGNWKRLMADIGRALLAGGFVVQVVDHVVHAMIASGDYEPYRSKKIDYSSGQSIGISWLRRDGDFYAAARKIKGAKWDGTCVKVPVTSADEVRDFAETAGFFITSKAARAFAAFDEFRANGLVVAVEKSAPAKVSFKLDKSNLADFQVADEFRDDLD